MLRPFEGVSRGVGPAERAPQNGVPHMGYLSLMAYFVRQVHTVLRLSFDNCDARVLVRGKHNELDIW
jgi:hypothetical protein